MSFRNWTICCVLLLLCGISLIFGANPPSRYVIGHAQVEIKPAVDKSFSAKCTADYVLEGSTCDPKACQAASTKAAEKLAALFSSKEGLHVQLSPKCECANGTETDWSASCDTLKGLARKLCEATPR